MSLYVAKPLYHYYSKIYKYLFIYFKHTTKRIQNQNKTTTFLNIININTDLQFSGFLALI